MNKYRALSVAAFLLLLTCLAFGQSSKLPILAVIDLRAENIAESDARVITDYVEEAIFKTGRYLLVERNQIRKVLEEFQYQQTGVCEKECAVAIGKQLAAAKVIIGTVSRLGEVYSIQLKLIDVESALIENIESIRKACTLGQLPDYIGIPVDKLVNAPTTAIQPQELSAQKIIPEEKAKRESISQPKAKEAVIPPKKPQISISDKKYFTSIRIGLSFSTGIIGIEEQFGHVALNLGFLPFLSDEGTPIAIGAKYYLRKNLSSFYIGSCLIFGSGALAGFNAGYRWKWNSRIEVNLGGGIGGAGDHLFDFEMLYPVFDVSLGYWF